MHGIIGWIDWHMILTKTSGLKSCVLVACSSLAGQVDFDELRLAALPLHRPAELLRAGLSPHPRCRSVRPHRTRGLPCGALSDTQIVPTAPTPSPPPSPASVPKHSFGSLCPGHRLPSSTERDCCDRPLQAVGLGTARAMTTAG